MKVLVVDDHEYNRKLLYWMLADEGHTVLEATNGYEAIEVFEKEEPDLILLDVMMPEMDGYEAAKRIKSQVGDEYVPIIFLTALSDEEALSKCLSSGGDDFLTKPFNEMILRAKISAHSRIRQLNHQIIQQNEELTYHRKLIDREHDIVRHVFCKALEDNYSDCDNIRSYISAMSGFNGDVFFVALKPTGGLYVMLGDFTGHGLSAAIGTLPTSKIFFAMTAADLPVGHIAKEINRELLKLLPDNMFLAANIFCLSESGTDLTAWVGGLHDSIVLDSDNRMVSRISSMHMPLGILDDDEFDMEIEHYKFANNEKIYCYTDGVTEAENSDGEQFGEDRLEALFKEVADDPFERVIEELANFRGTESQADDISLVEITCKPVTK